MAAKFSHAQDDFPVIFREDTDVPLDVSATVRNESRYGKFTHIATGGTCVIQSCKDFRLGRVVCHKSLRPKYENDPNEQIRFLREARVTAMLQHPNTLPVYDVNRDHSGKYSFTMKLIRGSTLREIIDRLRLGDVEAINQWTLRRLINVAIQAGRALSFAHAHGVVHRDIKPGNIIAGPFGEVLVLDWGLAKVWNRDRADSESPTLGDGSEAGSASQMDSSDLSLTSHGKLRATPLYMSPEQIHDSSDVDHRSDVYSFGALLYELLTLKDMAWGKTMYELIDHIEHDLPPRPSEKNADRDIPDVLESVCMRCVSKSPEDRIQTMKEIVDELQSWM